MPLIVVIGPQEVALSRQFSAKIAGFDRLWHHPVALIWFKFCRGMTRLLMWRSLWLANTKDGALTKKHDIIGQLGRVRLSSKPPAYRARVLPDTATKRESKGVGAIAVTIPADTELAWSSVGRVRGVINPGYIELKGQVRSGGEIYRRVDQPSSGSPSNRNLRRLNAMLTMRDHSIAELKRENAVQNRAIAHLKRELAELKQAERVVPQVAFTPAPNDTLDAATGVDLMDDDLKWALAKMKKSKGAARSGRVAKRVLSDTPNSVSLRAEKAASEIQERLTKGLAKKRVAK
ncbi:MAG: hypothetical protein HOP09_04290 [Hyphomicrobium sp.]|nr:hypothetical protein [Hyphomicrobium sp.]